MFLPLKLRMSPSTPLIPLNALAAWTGKCHLCTRPLKVLPLHLTPNSDVHGLASQYKNDSNVFQIPNLEAIPIARYVIWVNDARFPGTYLPFTNVYMFLQRYAENFVSVFKTAVKSLRNGFSFVL